MLGTTKITKCKLAQSCYQGKSLIPSRFNWEQIAKMFDELAECSGKRPLAPGPSGLRIANPSKSWTVQVSNEVVFPIFLTMAALGQRIPIKMNHLHFVQHLLFYRSNKLQKYTEKIAWIKVLDSTPSTNWSSLSGVPPLNFHCKDIAGWTNCPLQRFSQPQGWQYERGQSCEKLVSHACHASATLWKQLPPPRGPLSSSLPETLHRLTWE